MTFKELQDAVLFNSFGDRYRSLVSTYLNSAARDVCRRLELFHVEAVVAYDTDGLVDPTLRLQRVDDVWLADGSPSTLSQAFRAQARVRLDFMPLDQSAAAVPAAGTPMVFTAYQRPDTTGTVTQVRVFPTTTSGVVAVSGLSLPTAMVADTDTSGLGAETDDALVAFARMRAFKAEDDMQMGAAWNDEYERCLRTLSLGRATTGGPVITPGAAHLL